MSILLNGITLSPDLLWTDEFSPSVAQTSKRTLDGGSVLFAQSMQGRTITLESTSNSGWITRTAVLQLQALASTPSGQWTLNLHGTFYTVAFRHHEPPAFEASPLIPYSNPDADSVYLVKLKLMTV